MLDPTLSVQLYTVRDALQADLRGTVARLAEIGFTQVEPYDFTAWDGLGDALAAAGLTAPTTNSRFTGYDLDDLFAKARDLGASVVVNPWTEPERWVDAAGVAGVADELNAAAEVAAKYGLTAAYHNHQFELATMIDGQTALEFLVPRLDDRVRLQVDTYWAAVGGQDPARLLRRLGKLVVALHLKDGPISTVTTDQVAVGQGAMPVAEILAAAPHALRVIELDATTGDMFDAVRDSFAYLTAAEAA